MLCRTPGGAGGASPLPGHLPGLDPTAGPRSMPPSRPSPKEVTATGTRSVGGSAVPHAHSEQGHRRDVSPTALLPWPGAILNTFFLRVHTEYFTSCTEARLPTGQLAPPVWLWPRGLAASCPLQLPSHSAELRKGLKSQGETAHLLHAPGSLRGQRQPPSHPVLVTDEWEERTEGQGDSSEQGWGVWNSLGLEWVPWHEGRLGLQHLPGGTL